MILVKFQIWENLTYQIRKSSNSKESYKGNIEERELAWENTQDQLYRRQEDHFDEI